MPLKGTIESISAGIQAAAEQERLAGEAAYVRTFFDNADDPACIALARMEEERTRMATSYARTMFHELGVHLGYDLEMVSAAARSLYARQSIEVICPDKAACDLPDWFSADEHRAAHENTEA